MKRIMIPFALLVVVLGALLAVRLRMQGRAAHAPAGGSGEIEGTELDLSARINARIERIHVRKGQAVKQNDRLITFDCSEAKASLRESEARLRSALAQARAAELSIEAARGNKQVAAALRGATEAQAASLSAQRDAALRQAQRLDGLARDIALASRDQTRASADALAGQVRAMLAQAEANREQVASAGASFRVSGAQAESARALAQAAAEALERIRLVTEECELRAPRDAWVAEVPHEESELLPLGATAIRLIDLREVRATFYLPNAELAAVKPGVAVEAVADAYPGERFHGRVATVAFKAEFTPRNIQTRGDRDRLVYPIEVVLANADQKLRAGMPVEITVPGTERP